MKLMVIRVEQGGGTTGDDTDTDIGLDADDDDSGNENSNDRNSNNENYNDRDCESDSESEIDKVVEVDDDGVDSASEEYREDIVEANLNSDERCCDCWCHS